MPVVDNAIYVDGKRAKEPSSLDRTFEELREQCDATGNAFCWIGLLHPSADEIEAVAKEFGLHDLAVEDTVTAHQRPKIERYGDLLFMVLRPARYIDAEEEVEIGEVHLFVGPEFVITVRHAEEPDLGAVRHRLEEDPELLEAGPFSVLYAVLDKVVDDYSPVLDGLQDDIDEIEVQTFSGDPNVSRRIYQLTREVIEFQRAVEPLEEVFTQLRYKLKEHAGGNGALEKQQNPHLELRRNLRDVIDNATRILERTAAYRELLTNILQVNAALVGQRLTEAGLEQNEQMKKVSSWAAIFFAPTLVAGVYGMNFDHMPELHWALGYPFAFLLMVLFALVLYVIFKRRGWL